MRILYVCKAVDEDNPSLATQVLWIRQLAADPRTEHVTVVASRVGRHDLPDNVEILEFGSKNRLLTLGRFALLSVASQRSSPDVMFVVQGGPWPAVLLPIKLVTGRPIVQWKAHAHVSRRMRFYARFCDDLILTATPGSLPIASKKIRVIGHGIDTELFKPDGTATRDLVSVGRVSPIKGLHDMVEALAVCRDRLGAEYTLDLVGPCSSAHGAYRERVLRRVKELGLDEQIRFLGPRNFTSLPTLLASYRATLNFSSTALDKSVLESMAVGVPVVSTNPCVAEVLPEALTGQLVAPIGDSLTQAQRIRGVLSLSTTDRAELGKALRAIVVSDHALSGHMGRALDEIAKLVVSRRKRLGPSMSGPRSDRVSDAGPAPPR